MLLAQIPETFETYFEPFVGSARLFFALQPRKALLSDLNRELIRTYSALKRNVDEVYRLASVIPRDELTYYRIRKELPSPKPELVAAAHFIYLNRQCFNGVYRTNRAGNFNVPIGKRVGEFPSAEKFQICASSLRKARLMAGDFEEVLQRVKSRDFVYLDPPYAKARGRFRGEYGYNSFTELDILRLQRVLDRLDASGAKFLLSYSDCSEIRLLKEKWDSRCLLVRRQVAGFDEHRGLKREVLIANYALRSVRGSK